MGCALSTSLEKFAIVFFTEIIFDYTLLVIQSFDLPFNISEVVEATKLKFGDTSVMQENFPKTGQDVWKKGFQVISRLNL